MLACMFGPSIRTVFASRWKALLWSLGILATAYCSVPSEDQSVGAGETAQVASSVLGVTGQGKEADGSDDPANADNPWK